MAIEFHEVRAEELNSKKRCNEKKHGCVIQLKQEISNQIIRTTIRPSSSSPLLLRELNGYIMPQMIRRLARYANSLKYIPKV